MVCVFVQQASHGASSMQNPCREQCCGNNARAIKVHSVTPAHVRAAARTTPRRKI